MARLTFILKTELEKCTGRNGLYGCIYAIEKSETLYAKMYVQKRTAFYIVTPMMTSCSCFLN